MDRGQTGSLKLTLSITSRLGTKLTISLPRALCSALRSLGGRTAAKSIFLSHVDHVPATCRTDLGWQPGQMQPSQMPPARAPAQMPPVAHPQHPAAPAHLHPASGSGGSPYMDAPLTYQWTDGLPGQTPAPPIIPGYEDYVAACCSRRLPGIEPPALATNPPPQQQAQAYYENHERAPSYPGPGYDAPQLQPPYFGGPSPAPGALDPAAAPWVPPTSPPYASTQPSQSSTRMAPLAECDVKSRQAATASDQAALPGQGPGTIEGSSPTVPETDAKKASEVKDSSALEVLKTSATHSNTNDFLPHKEAADTPPQQAQLNLDMPNMPPPDSSPKLSTDLMTLQQDPPPPDQSPTLPTWSRHYHAGMYRQKIIDSYLKSVYNNSNLIKTSSNQTQIECIYKQPISVCVYL